MFTASWVFAGTAVQAEKTVPIQTEKAAPIQYDPSNYPAPERQGGETIADATVIGSLPYNDAGTTVGYVDDYDEVCPYTGSTSPDVVYSFTPAGDVTNGFVSLCGDTDYDSKLYIYENAVTPGAPFACNDDTCVSALGQSFVSELTGLTFVGGNTYYIVVDGYGGNSGNYEIDITGEGGGTTFDPPTDVVVDEMTGTISWVAPAGSGFNWLDDIDSYTAGEYLALQSDDWTTWSGTPGSAEDGYVVDENSNSGPNSVKVEGSVTDLVHEFGAFTSGVYEASMMMYIEPGYGGYYNLLHFFNGTSSEWGLEVYFGSSGTGDLCATAQNITTFSHPIGEWFEVLCIIDLDADWAEYYVDGAFIYAWQWSIDTMGIQGSCEFGATDIFAAAPAGDTVNFYFDDVMINEVVTRDLTGFNVYLDGVLDGSVGVGVLDYTYSDLVAGTSYTAGVSAVYDDGESDVVEVDFVYDPDPILDPPINLAVVSNPADDFATFTWEAPGGGGGDLFELVQHDGNAENAYYQAWDSGYGVVYDVSGYDNVTVEMIDFRHSSWGLMGPWDYNLHIVDWDTYTEIGTINGLQTTVNDDWELEIDLGSISASGLVGIFLEPLGNSAADAYPDLDADNVGPDGLSYFGPLSDYSGMALSEIGDFLMDLWIMGEETDSVVKAPRFKANFGNGNARIENSIPDVDFVTLNQTATTRDLLGYNVYLDGVQAGNTSDLFWEFTGLVNGVEYSAGVEAVYDEGVSDLVEITFLYEGTHAENVIVVATQLNNNYPNPFNPVTNISYSIIETGNVTLEVYNLRGQLVKTLVNDVKESGDYTEIWNGTDNSDKSVSSGVYFYKMKSSNYTATKKMILMK